MKHIIASAIIIALITVIVVVYWRKSANSKQGEDSNPYQALRNQILELDIQATQIESKHKPRTWAVMMETGYPEGTVTLVALLDGNASLYFENGGGIIGGITYEKVRSAAASMTTTAESFIPHCKRTDDFPLPKVSETIFYIKTNEGIFTSSATEEDYGENRHPLSPLFHAGHKVIRELRVAENQGSTPR